MTSSPPGLITDSPGLLSSSYSALEAGPSAQAPPPECLKHDHISQEDQARLPHFKPHRFGFLRGRRSQRDSGQRKGVHKTSLESDNTQGEERLSNDIEVSDIPFVRLDSGVLYREGLEEDYDKDVYRWAVVYENQRGAMLFSTPYYSRLSLLPTDPPAYTLPSATKQTRRHHPTVSLSSYPLPDGDWHWVSRTWMVDMRGDGHTQYDGFEYNWFFRTKHWSPLVGFMSAGGWVRRRRWVRLMVRPAIGRPHTGTASGTATPALRGISEELVRLRHTEAGATRPPSIMPSVDSGKEEQEEEAHVWTGDAEGDWERCHRALIHLDRDGRRLEVWERWLRAPAPPKDGVTRKLNVTAPPQKQWSEDSQPLPSQHAQFTSSTVDGMLVDADTGIVLEPAPREHVATVLHNHGSEILELFIFPDSRTRFIELVASAGLLSDLKSGLAPSHSMFDFYSSSQSIQNLAAGADSLGDSS